MWGLVLKIEGVMTRKDLVQEEHILRKCFRCFILDTRVAEVSYEITRFLFVCSFVSDALLSELAHDPFLIFCMKLGVSKHKKVTEPDF